MSDLGARFRRPREGWLSLALLILMLLALVWSVQGAAWLELMDFMGPVVVYGAIAGALLALLPVSVAFTLPAGALLGALIVIWAVGGEYLPLLDQAGRLAGLREDLLGWTETVVATGYPVEMSPFALGLGMLTWTTGFIAAHTVYRYHRVLDAILLVGVAMVINMSATFTDLFGHLLLFVAAAMLLWLRASLLSRQEGWQRRRVNENLEVPTSIMRSGVLFAAGSIVLAWVLTSVAVAAPLTEAWRNLDSVWTGVRDQFEGVFGSLTNPQSRITGDSFGNSFTVQGRWFSRDDEVLVVAASRPLYLRAVTYDVYTGRGWTRSEGGRRQVAAGELLLPTSTPERPNLDPTLTAEVLTIEMREAVGRSLFTAGYPLRIYAPSVVFEPGNQPLVGGIEAANAIGAEEDYQVEVALSNVTEAQLASAGTVYPDSIADRYLDTTGLPPRVGEEARRIVAAAGAADAYAQANALARFLQRDESFSYSTDAPTPDPGQDLVDFFLFDPEGGRTGYCQYYASAMVMMARTLGIPARVAAGFAPGERQEDGTFLVRQANAHAWAELYFPGYGWQIFEATKSINPQFARAPGVPLDPNQPPPNLPANAPQMIDLLEDTRSTVINPLPSFNPIPGGFDAAAGQPTPGDEERQGNAIVFLVLIGGAAVYLWIHMRRLQRRWRFLPAGERAWQRMALAAERAGVGQRPSETFYEYAGWLEEQIPTRRPEIRTIADGKVWHAYSGRPMSGSAMNLLEEAWRRLRLPFVALALRRWLRGLIRR